MEPTKRSAKKRLTIALAGNPNAGKTTVFNALTGARQHVGNYPGVTVERKEGVCRFEGREITIVDLPGTYSLTANSIDELVARDFIVEERPDVVIDVLDTSRLERNLYLATQLIELNVHLVLAFNMTDVARARGYEFKHDQLSQLMGAPIVEMVASKSEGIQAVLREAVALAEAEAPSRHVEIDYGRDVNREVRALTEMLSDDPLTAKYPAHWLAVKLLENDSQALDVVGKGSPRGGEILARKDEGVSRLSGVYGEDPEIVIAEARYGFISGACEETVLRTVEARHDVSDHIDMVMTHRVFGLPIFLALMWFVFQLTFKAGDPPKHWIEAGFAWLGSVVGGLLPEGYLRSLIVDGVIAGVGGVVVFLPNILLLFLAIAFLEDTGYMARAAFVMDRIMHKIGLHGKSFIPLLIGFGCSVPAVMATRSLESRRDRLATILVVPLVSCGARLPVYVLLTGACFGPAVAGNVIFSVYVLGIVMVAVMAKLFRKYLVRGPSTAFVMELPPYRMPTLKGVLIHMWHRGWLYLKKAGTVILVFSMVMWALATFPTQPALEKEYGAKIAATDDPVAAAQLENELAQKRLEDAYAARIGRGVAWALRPIGLGNWRVGTALFAGFGAKEVVVSTLGTLYALGETSERSDALQAALRRDLSPLQAYTFMVFVLIYVPCVAALAVIRRETNSWRWMLFAAGYTTALAWVVCLVVYRGGRLLGALF